MFEVSPIWKRQYPEAHIGVLAMDGVSNPIQHDGLNIKKKELEKALRVEYASEDRKSLRRIPTLATYHAYYRTFRKNYHVQHQLESIVFKGKSIPKVAALVEAMFMAELKNLLLTAGHDLEAIEPPLQIGVASGGERYRRLSGEEQIVQVGDMVIADQTGIVSSIIYGPDQRTRISPETEQVIFTVYAPPGIQTEAVQGHLDDIRENVRLIAPDATVVQVEVFGTI